MTTRRQKPHSLILASAFFYLAAFGSLSFFGRCFTVASSNLSPPSPTLSPASLSSTASSTPKFDARSSDQSLPKSKFRVRQVQIIHRHGDRTPITPLKDEEYWQSTLPEPHVLDGIAKRTSLIRPEGAPTKAHGASGRGPFGQLTTLGILQMVGLGERLREELSHWNEEHNKEENLPEQSSDRTHQQHDFLNQGRLFTPRKPLDPSRVSVMSTDFPRTIQSVQALLTGLFPDLPNTIEIDVRHTNSYLIPDPQPRQSPHQLVLEQHLSTRPHLLKREEDLKEYQKRVTQGLKDVLGEESYGVSYGIGEEKHDDSKAETEQAEKGEDDDIKPLPWTKLYEILTCLQSRDLLPPALSDDDVHAVSEHVAWKWFENLRHPILAKTSMWKFANKLVESMEKKVEVECKCVECLEDEHGKHFDLFVKKDLDSSEECRDEPWLCIYSGHDSSLIGLLCVLQLERPKVWPEYGSYLKIELIREELDLFDDKEGDSNKENTPPGSNRKVLNHWVRFSLNGQILRSTWMKDDNGEPATMVPLEKLAEMIHSEHEMDEEFGDGPGLKYVWKNGLLAPSN